MTNLLNPYVGPLTAAEVAVGIAAAQANADRLIADAKALIGAERYPSAAALAILAMEERGKVSILKRLLVLDDPREFKEAWRDYRTHRAKNSGWIIPILVAEGARTLHDMASAVDKDGEHAALLDALKQLAFYTDCLGDRHWSIPAEVVDADLARSMLVSAEMMWGANPVTERELELWFELVGPKYDKPGMAAAVVAFQAALHAEGLSDTHPDRLRAFMEGQPIAVWPEQ